MRSRWLLLAARCHVINLEVSDWLKHEIQIFQSKWRRHFITYQRTYWKKKISYTGCGKITSVNFKVNNEKNYSGYKNCIFGFWNYNMGSFKSHSLKKNILRVVAVVWVQRAWETTKRDRLTVSMFSGVPEVRGRPHLFSDTLPVPLKFSTHNTTAECCNGNFPTTCTFRAQSHPYTASLPSQCPTESTEDMLPHPVDVNTEKKKQAQ